VSRVISETVTVPDSGLALATSQPGSHDPTSAAGPAGPGAVTVSLSMSDPTVRLLARTSGGRTPGGRAESDGDMTRTRLNPDIMMTRKIKRNPFHRRSR
jgi:hypothetical protein